MKMLHCQSLKEVRVSTPAENRVGDSSARKGFDRLRGGGEHSATPGTFFVSGSSNKK